MCRQLHVFFFSFLGTIILTCSRAPKKIEKERKEKKFSRRIQLPQYNFCLRSLYASSGAILPATRLMDFKWSLSIKNVNNFPPSLFGPPLKSVSSTTFMITFSLPLAPSHEHFQQPCISVHFLSFIFQIIPSNNLISDNAESDTSHENMRSEHLETV